MRIKCTGYCSIGGSCRFNLTYYQCHWLGSQTLTMKFRFRTEQSFCTGETLSYENDILKTDPGFPYKNILDSAQFFCSTPSPAPLRLPLLALLQLPHARLEVLRQRQVGPPTNARPVGMVGRDQGARHDVMLGSSHVAARVKHFSLEGYTINNWTPA